MTRNDLAKLGRLASRPRTFKKWLSRMAADHRWSPERWDRLSLPHFPDDGYFNTVATNMPAMTSADIIALYEKLLPQMERDMTERWPDLATLPLPMQTKLPDPPPFERDILLRMKLNEPLKPFIDPRQVILGWNRFDDPMPKPAEGE